MCQSTCSMDLVGVGRSGGLISRQGGHTRLEGTKPVTEERVGLLNKIFVNRPSIAWAVLQTPLWFIHLLINLVILCGNIFKTPSVLARRSQGADVFKEGLPPPTMCKVSHFPCQVSHVPFHVSHVICKMSKENSLGQSGEASHWRVCCQRGLPRFVL